jgi:hypothetical protein
MDAALTAGGIGILLAMVALTRSGPRPAAGVVQGS